MSVPEKESRQEATREPAAVGGGARAISDGFEESRTTAWIDMQANGLFGRSTQ
ncbi:unnamed protein product [Ectocarpus sp. CCAP 1310/34]|nr:unnamed protein product [Ectocarpus sp. CCAP 1310/34]